jgi:hypothetical protein
VSEADITASMSNGAQTPLRSLLAERDVDGGGGVVKMFAVAEVDE